MRSSPQRHKGTEPDGNREIRERPILFTGEMVRAILEDRKSQTRRVVSTQPQEGCQVGFSTFSGRGAVEYRRYTPPHQSFVKCPYGAPGDGLWVRETFAYGDKKNNYAVMKDGGQKYKTGEYFEPSKTYRAGAFDHIKWKPSIFMPRWASRIDLVITKVSVERVQDITPDDCLAEGIELPSHEGRFLARITGKFLPSDYLPVPPLKATEAQWLVAHYAGLWDSINAARGFGWARNPWVWVVEFKRKEFIRKERREHKDQAELGINGGKDKR